jgi:hypothetical protein
VSARSVAARRGLDMSRQSCSFCGRRGTRARLPRGWKVHGNAILCMQCRRERYRLRSITMQVVESIGAAWRDLRTALGGSWRRATLGDGAWEARIQEGRPVVRVLIRERWWDLRLKSAAWTGGQRAAYEKLAFGEAAGELLVYRVPTEDPSQRFEIMCRMVVWLPRERMRNTEEPHDAFRIGRVGSLM